MKKFGTPIGAGPGRACVKVGLAVVGTPSGWRTVVGPLSAVSLTSCSALSLAFLTVLPTVFWFSWPPAETCGTAGVATVGVADVVVGCGAVLVDVPVSCEGGVGLVDVPVSAGGG